MLGTLDGGRICWLLSEILFFRPKMNKQKSDLALKKAASYVMRRLCQPVWFNIHQPEIIKEFKYILKNIFMRSFGVSPWLLTRFTSVHNSSPNFTLRIYCTRWSDKKWISENLFSKNALSSNSFLHRKPIYEWQWTFIEW